jgi:lipoprotein NlpD
MTGFSRLVLGWWALAAALLLGACSSKPLNSPPVEDRNAANSKTTVVDGRTSKSQTPLQGAPGAILPGAENAGKPGYYTVKPGDMLIRIALEAGQSHKDVARWNSLDNPNKIEVGQVLRIIPPAAGEVVAKPVVTGIAAATPLAAAPAASSPVKAVGPALAASAPALIAPTSSGDDEINWIWPASGSVLSGFDDVKNKGVDIGGAAGEVVLAAADGRVVYAGAGLRGYGNLIILKHNNVYLTAYAHNQTLLVKEDQAVKKGQKIAEMGNSDADRVKLHFEVRRQGKPVDPLKYLPPR